MNWGLSSLLHVMHMCREVNLASSSSWMYIAYIIYCFMFTFNWHQDALIDIHVSFGILIKCTSYDLLFTPYLHHLCFRQKGGEHWFIIFNPLLFLWLEQKGGEGFGFIYISLYAFICFFFERKKTSLFVHLIGI